MNNSYQLVMRKGPKPGQVFSLYSVTTTIGRDPISDIAINDPEVSRQHARLTQTADSYQIEDLESTNGTFVNGVQIGAEPVQLAHGNEVQFGSGVILLFELTPDDEPDEMGLKTAVPTRPLKEPKPEPDPMLPPDFDHLSIIDSIAVTNPQASTADIQDELDKAFAQAEAPPADIPRLSVPSAATPPPPAKDENPARRMVAIGAALIFLMMCCCCFFLLFMYQWGGDWLLQQMGLVP